MIQTLKTPRLFPKRTAAGLALGRPLGHPCPRIDTPRPPEEPPLSEYDAILFANEAFYRAFADRDAKAMDELWSREAPVTCLHPGWGPLETRHDVLESWRRILGNEASPAVICRRPRAFIHGPIAIVLCYEQIEDQLLVATNIFRHEGRQWRLIHHQAGPTAVPVPEEEAPEEPQKPN